MSKLQTHRQSLEASSDTSYCERETWDDEWGSRSTLSQLEEVATASSGRDDAAALRAERDALARALAAEKSRSAAAARAHDARLAELHGVIAELVRRRAADKHAAAIPEEEVSDECESTTQPAGELENDQSRTEQNDSSSALSPSDLPTPQDQKHELPDDTTDTSTQQIRAEQLHVQAPTPPLEPSCASLHLSERDSQLCVTTARCCQLVRNGEGSARGASSCEREHGSADGKLTATSPGRCESRQAKLASRVRLRKTEDSDSNHHLSTTDEGWCADVEAAERLALDVCAQADLREALVAASNDGCALSASVAAWRARCARLEADCRVLHCALARATDTAHRLSCACAVQESSCVSLCCALRAADRALETYDVLLALQETQPGTSQEREAAELVAKQLLARLDAEHAPSVGEPLLSPGPWLQHDTQCGSNCSWTAECEARLRGHAARLKSDTVTLRNLRPPPQLFSHHEIAEEDLPKSVSNVSMAEMEAAVMMQEVLSARETRAMSRAAELARGIQHDVKQPQAALYEDDVPQTHSELKSESSRRRRRERHWLDAASETDL